MRGELRGLSGSVAAQKSGKAWLLTKVFQWETKLAEVRGIGHEEQIRMAEDNLRKAKATVVEKKNGIEALDRSVRRIEVVLAAAVDKVKVEEVEEVVEVDMEPEEMVEETVKEEVEAKVLAETPAGGGGGGGGGGAVAQGDDGVGMWGPSRTCHGIRTSWLAPIPQPWTPPYSSPRRVRFGLSGFCCSRCTSGCWRGGRWVWVDEGGGPPGQAPAAGGGQRAVGVATGVAGEEMGGDAPPPPPPGNGAEDV